MGKDPAFLFYSDNFQSGTQFFTDEQVGKYIRLLCAQHLHGHLTEKQVKIICKSYDKDTEEIMQKFVQDDHGLWYNKRLELEINRRKNYVDSRAKNRIGKKKTKKIRVKNTSLTYDNHMGNENEDGNGIENKKENGGGIKKNAPPTISEVQDYFFQNGYSREAGAKAWEYYNSGNWHDSKGNPVKNWKQKMQGVWFKDENRINHQPGIKPPAKEVAPSIETVTRMLNK